MYIKDTEMDAVKKMLLAQIEPYLSSFKREDAKKCRARILYRLLEGGTYKQMGYDLGLTACRVCQIRDSFLRHLPMGLKLYLLTFLAQQRKNGSRRNHLKL